MTPTMLVFFILVLLVVLLAIRMPVAFALGLSGAIGLLLLRSLNHTTNVLGSLPFTETASFSLTIIPMFTLMGMLAVKARIAEQVFAVAAYLFKRLPGGLGVAAIMASAGFAAVSGSSIGTAATMSKLSVGEMRKYGYPLPLASAAVAVAGTLGVLIPPSVFLVLYAIMVGESVAEVLAAGIIPGILSAFAYAAYMIYAMRKHTARTAAITETMSISEAVEVAAGKQIQVEQRRGLPSDGWHYDARSISTVPVPQANVEGTDYTNIEHVRQLPWRGVARIGILFFIVLGGMYSGVFTPTESAAIGALVAGIMLAVEMFRDGFKAIVGAFIEAFKETAGTTSMVFSIIVGSTVLSAFFVQAKVPRMLTNAVLGWGLPPHLTLGIMLLALIPLGMALESISILVITVPLIYPVAMELGFSGVWLAVLIVKLIEIGLVTPPVGINGFVVAGTANIKASDVFRGVLPFVLVDMAVLVLLFFVPAISTWLPSLVRV
ncbi:MAG: TRAP transporter large permease [Actinomycetaceae bacterium]|nr:TRAP transporter large permease [Actinomycetaceae bacterium]